MRSLAEKSWNDLKNTDFLFPSKECFFLLKRIDLYDSYVLEVAHTHAKVLFQINDVLPKTYSEPNQRLEMKLLRK